MRRKVILFELNEVPFKIIDYFVERHPDSTFASLIKSSNAFTTVSEDGGSLSPWKTWPSLHRGVPVQTHFINDFGQPLDEVDKAYPPIWSLLAESGAKVGICGSLHSYPLPTRIDRFSFYLPDIFAARPDAYPAHLVDFQHLCLSMARESARNVSTSIPMASALRVLSQTASLGFTAATLSKIGSQLVAERMHPWKSSRRRALQSIVNFDVFARLLERTRPDFTTFFTNHVAAAMHRYWAAAFPGEYLKPTFDESWVKTYSNEIDHAMQTADNMLTRLKRFADKNAEYLLVVTSSMGQEAVAGNPREIQVYIREPIKFLARLGLAESEWQSKPAMFAQYNIQVDESKLGAFLENLRQIQIAGEPLVFRLGPHGFVSIDFGHENLPECQVSYRGQSEPLESWGLFNFEILDKSGCTAYHIPQGSLLIYGAGRKSLHRPAISALEVAPAIIKHFEVSAPIYMQRTALVLDAS